MTSHYRSVGGSWSWKIDIYESELGDQPYSRFTGRELSDTQWAALDAALTLVLAPIGLDLIKTDWLKALGKGLYVPSSS
jgi:hypothetical protein